MSDAVELKLLSGLAQDAREAVEDVHHRLHHRKVIGDADVLAHVFEQAAQAGVPEHERERWATEAFGRLVVEATPSGRRWRRAVRARRADAVRRAIPAGSP